MAPDADVDIDRANVMSAQALAAPVRGDVGYKPTPMQPAFQPSSTPVAWSNRFMVSSNKRITASCG